MASYNRVILVGNLTRDPDYKQLTSGQAVCRLGLATNRQFKNRQTGEMVQEVCFVDIDVWGAQADSCNQYLQKGRSILVEGRLKLDMWQDNEGQRRSKHSIVADRVTFLGSASSETAVQGDTQEERQTMSSVQTTSSPQKNSSAAQDLQAKTAAPAQGSTGEVAFKDEEPFKDDLPF